MVKKRMTNEMSLLIFLEGVPFLGKERGTERAYFKKELF